MNTGDFIPYGRQTIDEDDIKAVTDVLRSAFLTTGPKVKEFENAIADYVKAKEAVAVSSGTAALHAAMAVAGLGPGDEVLVPSLSFLATANAALYVGAKPVFVDSLADGFNMDPQDAARKITKRTKAIAPVDFAGQPLDKSIYELAKERNLLVIEDAAHALGATQSGRMIGSIADMTIFSFHPVKHITTGEGGMVTCQDPARARQLRQFRHHGIDVDVVQRDTQQRWSYDMTALGYNYRLTDLQCALGISQLKKSERFLERREAIAKAYDAAFADLSFVRLPPRPLGADRHAWHLYIIRLDSAELGFSRDEAFNRLRSRKIGAHVHYRPIHLHPYYCALGWKAGDCPKVEKTFQTMLSLPIYPGMTPEMVDRVIDGIKQLGQVKV